jgi:hypothetical protein
MSRTWLLPSPDLFLNDYSSLLPAACDMAAGPASISSVSPSATPAATYTAVVEPPLARPTPAATASEGWSWETLRRPVQLPAIAPGTPCPHPEERALDPGLGSGLGEGPVYPVQPGLLDSGMPVEGDWWGHKVPWASSPDYRGPALVRVYKLNESDGQFELADVRFSYQPGWSAPMEVSPELRLQPGEKGSIEMPGLGRGWRGWTSNFLVRTRGCYAYQIDGLGFTQSIVFEITW